MLTPYTISGNVTVMPSTSAVNYCSLTPAPGAVGWGTSNVTARSYITVACEIANLTLNAVSDPGAGKSYAIEIEVNSGAKTGLTATISNGVLTANSGSSHVRLEPGDYICVKSTPAGTPATMTRLAWSFSVDSLGSPQEMLFVAAVNPAISAVRYAHVFTGQYVPTATVNVANVGKSAIRMKVNGLRLDLRDAPGAGKSWTLTLYVNGAATAATVTITGAGTVTGSISGLNVQIAEGDEVYYRYDPAGSPTLTYHMITLTFTPENEGEYPISVSTSSVINSATGWTRAISTFTSETTTADTNPKCTLPNGQRVHFRKHRCYVDVNPGGVGKQWETRLRVNGVNQNSSVAITNGNTSGVDSSNIDSVFGGTNLISLQITPTSTPAAITNHYYCMASYTPRTAPCMI